MDTAGDYRILVAEDALNRLEAAVRSWGLPHPLNKHRVLEILREMRGRLLRIKYGFLPSRVIVESDDYARLGEDARRLLGVLLPRGAVIRDAGQRLRVAEIRYSLWTLLGLGRRLLLGEENLPEHAVDVVGAEITRVSGLAGYERLLATMASTGTARLTIVTSMRDVRVGEIRGAAILPPILFGDVVSEAMYATPPLGDRGLVGRRVPAEVVSSEVRAAVIRVASGKGGPASIIRSR